MAISYADLFTVNPGEFYNKTVTSQAEANALNARGAQQVSYVPSADGKTDGTYLMRVAGKDPAILQQQLGQLMLQEHDAGVAAQQKQYSDVMTGLDNYGGFQSDQLNRQYQQLGAKTDQNLQSRGLTNSTVAANAQRGVMQDLAFAQNNLQSSLQKMRLDYMASRNIQYPSLDQIGALALQAVQNPVGGNVPSTGYVAPGSQVAPSTVVDPRVSNPNAYNFIPTRP